MRALVMAAGLGTRLRPLTDTLPKPLVPVNGKPMIEYVLANLKAAGVREAIVNIHYLPEEMRNFAADWNRRGMVPRLEIQDESAEILGSGGAVSTAASWLFAEENAALVCNSDVLGNPDLKSLIALHKKLNVECTLSMVKHPDAGIKYTGLRKSGDLVVKFERVKSPDPELWMFPGYYVVESKAMARLPKPGVSFSIMEKLWEPLLKEGKLGGWSYPDPFYDLGTVQDLRNAEAALKG